MEYKVSVKPYHRYIIVKGWDQVVTLLNAYGDGPKYTHNKTVGDFQDGMSALFFSLVALNEQSKLPTFIRTMAEEAKARLETNDEWDKSYDYDAMGTPFFKTSVTIKVLDRETETYGVGFYAAYVGEKPENELAQSLGLRQALVNAKIILEYPIEGESFYFDFAPIAKRLSETFKGIYSAAVFVATIAGGDPFEHPRATLVNSDVYQASLGIDSITVNARYKQEWMRHGAAIQGGLTSWDGGKTIKNPCLDIFFSKTNYGESYETPVFWQEDEEKKMLEIVESVAKALAAE